VGFILPKRSDPNIPTGQIAKIYFKFSQNQPTNQPTNQPINTFSRKT